MRRPWLLVSAAWIVPASLAAVNEFAQRRIYGHPPPSAGEVLFISLDWLFYAVLTPAVFAISQRWPLTRPRLASRAVLHFILSIGFCAAWAAGGILLQAILVAIFRPPQFQGLQFVSWFFTTLPFGVAVYLCMVGMEHAIRYFIDARHKDVQMARLSEQLQSARFAALQAQLNPHFLFNTLNTIAVLVRDDDRKGAVRIVEQLSDVLRRTLNRGRANEVALEDEIDLVRQYLAIEQARFSDRLRVTLTIAPGTQKAAVPSFAVQHLVENAIRHGIAKRLEAGTVRVVSRLDGDMLEIAVSDDGPGISADAAQRAGHGLENTRDRLRALYGDRVSLALTGTRSGTIAVLRLPFRELPPEAGHVG